MKGLRGKWTITQLFMCLSDMYGAWFLYLFNVTWKRNTKCCLWCKNKDKLAVVGEGKGAGDKLQQVFPSAYYDKILAMEADYPFYLSD